MKIGAFFNRVLEIVVLYAFQDHFEALFVGEQLIVEISAESYLWVVSRPIGAVLVVPSSATF